MQQSIKIPQKDLDEINQKWLNWQQTLRSDFNKWETQTLKQHILRGAEIIKLKIDLQLLDLTEDGISSYLYKELLKEGVQVSDRYVRNVLPDNYKNQSKRNYFDAEHSSALDESKWNTISDAENLIEKDQYGNFRIDGKVQQDKPEPKGVKEDWSSEKEDAERQHKEENTKKLLSKYPEYKVILKWELGVKTFLENVIELRNKYIQSLEPVDTNQDKEKQLDEKAQKDEMRKQFAEFFTQTKINELDKDADDFIINQFDRKELLDWRLRIRKYEKLIAKMMMRGDSFIHEIAKKLHCSAKHCKNDILREDIEKDLKKFKCCPKCGEDIADHINKELIKFDYEEEQRKLNVRFN